MSEDRTIAFIGAGNMARSLIGGLIQDGYNSDCILACDPDPAQRERLTQRYPVQTAETMEAVVAGADCCVLAVKPQVLPEVARQMGGVLHEHRPLIVSIAAGIKTGSLAGWIGRQHAIVRCMPNTPSLIQAGATALYANERASGAQRELAESIMRAVGTTLWVDDEAMLDVVTAVSGSGPAYVFLVIEAMQKAGEALGLAPAESKLLVLQTVFGAAKMALEDPEPVEELRARVTSKGGTTEKALAELQTGDLAALFRRAIGAAHDRSKELADRLDEA